MAKLISISLLDEEISAERLMEALNKLSSRDLRKYFKRKKMVFPRNIRYAFLTKCIKRDFQAVSKDLLDSNNRVFTEFELVEFYKCVENDVLAQEFKKDFLANFVKNTYKNLLTDKNLADLYEIAQTKEEGVIESIYGFLVGLNPIFTDTEENNLDCLPVEQTAQRIKDQFTLFEVREFAKKYGVVVPKYPNAEIIGPAIVEKAEARQLLDEEGFANLQNAESYALLSFAKKNGIYAPRYLKKDEMVDEVISQISSKSIDNVKVEEVFNENLITFKARSSNDSLCDLLDKYENLDDLSEVRNDNSKDMSPLKRCAVGGAIGLELRYNEDSRKARLLERRRKLEELRELALERKERLNRERREQQLIAQRDASEKQKSEEELRRIAAEERVKELEALLAQQNAEKEEADKARIELEEALKEEEAKRLAAEKALEEAPKVVESVVSGEVEEEVETFGEDEIVVPEYVDTVVSEEYEVEENKDITVMECEVVEEEAYVPEVVEEPVVEEIVEEVIEEQPEEVVSEETIVEETPVEEETPAEEEPQVEPVKCPVKKMHGIGWILTVVVVAALACLYFLVPKFNTLFTNVFLKNDALEFRTIEYITLFGVTVIVTGILTLIIRTIAHAIKCKAKKGVACHKLSECYKYLWTHLVVTVIAAFAFIYAKLFHYDAVRQNIGNLFGKIFGSTSSELNIGEILLVIGLIFFVAYLVTLLVSTLGYLFKFKKLCNKGIMGRYISFSWTYVVVGVLVTVVLFVVSPSVVKGILKEVIATIPSAFSFSFGPLVVNAAEAGANGGTSLTSDQIILTAIVLFVVVYLLALVIMSVCYSRHIKKLKEKELAALKTEEETPVEEEIPVEEQIEEEVEEEGERLLFTTFEEAKLVEDLNDLNRMIGKVNEHVKDLSAIQARLYNELVGEEEIIVEPVIEEQPIVIPELPKEGEVEQITTSEPALEEVNNETPNVEKEKKEKVKCSVRKGQKVWLVITLLALVAFVVLAFVFEPVKTFAKTVLDVFKLEKVAGKTNIAILAGTILLVTALVSFILRLLIHPLTCKAKKGKKCYQRKENAAYLWTYLVVFVLIVALLYLNNWHSFKTLFTKGLDAIKAFPKIGKWGVAFIVGSLFILILFIASICSSVSANRKVKDDEKKAKLAEEERAREEALSQEQANEKEESPYKQDVMYIPCMVNGSIQMMPVNQPSNANLETGNAQVSSQAIQNLQPLQIVQPIQLIQPISSIPVDYQDYNNYQNSQANQYQVQQKLIKDEELLAESKENYRTLRSKKTKSIVALILIIALVVALFVVETTRTFIMDKVALIKNIPNLDIPTWCIFVGGIVLVLLFVILFIRVISLSKKIKKEKRYIRDLEEIIAQESQIANQTIQSPFGNMSLAPNYGNPYNPGMYEDINSPYNMYRANNSEDRSSNKRSSKVGKIFTVLGIVLVLAVAYAVLAYAIPSLPLHDFIKNLF